jgi:enamine deaminase RidA (YjgF/YER057c/UK114 family)
MTYTTIRTEAAKPVANYKLATRREQGQLVYISGQVAWDEQGNIVGKNDIAAQARQVFANLRRVLHAAGGDFEHLLKITTYLTTLDHFPAVAQARQTFLQGELPASTLIIVSGLFHPDFLLEIEGIAVIE